MLKNKGSLAISQIIILMISIIAISYAIGSEFSVVSAQEAEQCIRSEERGGFTFISEVNKITDVKQWCNDNGRSAVCSGGSENWQLRGDKFFDCSPSEGPPTPGASNTVVTDVARGVAVSEFTRLLNKYIRNPSELTDEQIEVVAKGLEARDFSAEIAGRVRAREALTISGGEVAKKAPGFFKRYVTGNFYKKSLATGVVVGGVIVVITFFSVGIKTGDWGRAREAAGRVAIGAGVGLGAYVGAVALGLGPAGWIAGGFVMLGVWASKFLSREQERTINFQCKPWQPQTGGDNCNSCDDGYFPCTEYQCRSLGTGCELINKDTDEPRCIHKDRNDVDPPEITPWGDFLSEGYKYDPLPRGQTGVEIKYQDEECLPSFAPFALGVELDKEGYCRIEWERTPTSLSSPSLK